MPHTPTVLTGNKQSVIISTTFPESVLRAVIKNAEQVEHDARHSGKTRIKNNELLVSTKDVLALLRDNAREEGTFNAEKYAASLNNITEVNFEKITVETTLEQHSAATVALLLHSQLRFHLSNEHDIEEQQAHKVAP